MYPIAPRTEWDKAMINVQLMGKQIVHIEEYTLSRFNISKKPVFDEQQAILDIVDGTVVPFLTMYLFPFEANRKAADLSKPIDKRIYKGTQPTCHDFNHLTATAESVSLLVGFSAGQVQLIDPIKKETSKLFNEESLDALLSAVALSREIQNELQRLIDKSRVTCVKWVPGSESLFLVAHSSGNMYLYNVEHTCGTTAPHYQLLKQGESFAVHTCKSKSTRNPLLKWTVGEGALNEFAFSPDGKFLAARTHTNVMNATSPPAGSNGNSVTTPGNSVPPPLPRSNSLPHSAVSNAGSKSSVMDGAIASGVSKFATLSLHDRKERHHEKDHKRNHSMGHISSKSSDKLNLVTKAKTDPAKTLGTSLCPRMEDVPLLEPLISAEAYACPWRLPLLSKRVTRWRAVQYSPPFLLIVGSPIY
ncbi:hypothetical protein A6R68_05758 [Neotoma lepida]|uniref:Uncharacterized protein n=1 Tax=Neotoma lepida TaxID=56216 RepID=A0A1A6GIV8_NEOLE|nr:hypothetical protein A6R68_05758 [Neotoma lepida]